MKFQLQTVVYVICAYAFLESLRDQGTQLVGSASSAVQGYAAVAAKKLKSLLGTLLQKKAKITEGIQEGRDAVAPEDLQMPTEEEMNEKTEQLRRFIEELKKFYEKGGAEEASEADQDKEESESESKKEDEAKTEL